jgi:hypothetical protein
MGAKNTIEAHHYTNLRLSLQNMLVAMIMLSLIAKDKLGS